MTEDERLLEYVVWPAVRALFRPHEIDDVRVEEVDGQLRSVVVANNESADWTWLRGDWETETDARLRERLVSDLQDFIAESRFGWGTWRDPRPIEVPGE